MEGLIDDDRRSCGEHPDWDDDQGAVVDQRRVRIRAGNRPRRPRPRRLVLRSSKAVQKDSPPVAR